MALRLTIFMIVHFVMMLFVLVFAYLPAHADEKVGRLVVQEILLRPTYFSQESEGGEFSFSDSMVSFEWLKDENISAHIAIGSLLERSIPAIYLETPPAEQLGFVEAYAQYSGIYGHIRAGLVPLGFGSTGLEKNHERIWPKSMLFSERIVGERDYGISFLTENNGFFSELTFHNGEVDQKPSDGNLWISTRWGWENARRFQIQISGQAGHSDPAATGSGSTSLLSWDRTRGAQWRFVALAAAWRPRYWDIQLQSALGQREQDSKTDSLLTYQFDCIHYFDRNWGFGLRHDQLDPSTKTHNDQVLRESAMLVGQSDDGTSLLSFVFTKRLEEKNQVPNDEAWLQWRVTPFVK